MNPADNQLAQTRPQLKRTVEVFEASNGTIFILPGHGASDFVLESATPEDRHLIDSFTGKQTADEIAARHSAKFPSSSHSDVLGAIAGFADAGLLVDARAQSGLSAEALDRYSRQIAYFADGAPYGADPADAQRRLSSATVTVFGLGGVGSWILAAICAAGVGKVIIADGDTVELSNLNRQVIYSMADLGQSKATAAAAWIRRFNPNVAVEAHDRYVNSQEDVALLIKGTDFVVEAADSPVHLFSMWTDAACREAGVPHMSLSNLPPLVRVGPTFVPIGACLACYERSDQEAFRFYEELKAHRSQRPAFGSATPQACALIGAMASSDIIHYITDVGPVATAEVALTVDMTTFEVTRERVKRYDDCAICGRNALQQ